MTLVANTIGKGNIIIRYIGVVRTAEEVAAGACCQGYVKSAAKS